MIEKIIAFSAKNGFLIGLAIVFLAAWGLWAAQHTPLDAIPDLSDVQVIVFTEWPGRAPQIVEDQITYPIVTTMLGAPRVQVVRGFSYFGLSFVYIIFEDGTDMYWARSRILEYMNEAMKFLPEGITPTLGPDATGVGWGFEYAVVDTTGKHDLAELRTLQDWYIRYWLKAVPGVSDVASVGGYVKQYQVNIDPNALLAYNLPLNEVIRAIRLSNNDVGGRVVEFTGREYMVWGRGYVQSVADLERISVGTDEKGTPILLKDLARVELGPDLRRGFVELNGEGEVAGGIVVIRFGEDTLGVIERVKAKMQEIAPALPEGVQIIPTYDRSELILRSIETLKEKLVEESVMVSAIIVLFLFHVRSALVAILTLPLAILMSITAMYYLGISSNIMSLGGIAIAIGAMVDGAIVMIENAHKKLEHGGAQADRTHLIIEAAKEVGKPLFFSLLIITVSFLPVFTLEAQEGRLFRPLAYTKTFAMGFAAMLSITVVPLLMVLLIRGNIASESRNPLARLAIAIYRPIAHLVFRYRKTTVSLAILVTLATWPTFLKLGSEFMPPLYEGTLMYMPVTLPGASITEMQRLLQVTDRIIKQFPEVEQVFGKAGRARTATDPAPLTMMETVITLKPEEHWRPGMTIERLENELDQALQIPGVSNAWTMPIKGRLDMLTTGIRTPLGIKIYGTDLKEIQRIGGQIEQALREVPGTRNIFAERTAGGYYVFFQIDRDAIARYGLLIEDVEHVIESAIGGSNISTTIEGRERFPVNLRYSRGFRNSLEDLKRVLVSTPHGQQIPITQLADIRLMPGPTVVKSEGSMLVGYVYVDVAGRDLGSYVEDAKKIVAQRVQLPNGYYLGWSGQYEYMQRAAERLMYVVPLTILIVFLLLYLNFRSIIRSIIVLLSVPFAAVGAIWSLYLLGYNLSVAVWVGIIALIGVAAEIGVIMIAYLDQAYAKREKEGALTSPRDLIEGAFEGSVQRVRPIMMTVVAITGGLLPIMWGHGTGADVMKRIAAPMIGGMITTTILTLLVIPAIYILWQSWERRHRLEAQTREPVEPARDRGSDEWTS
ncbi:MAG: efflux RND transporter permease subunit [Nitrospirae bacterium]|nr:MAG: efflux RND transporter permease subunit [Nitrospirota bacterium]